MKLLKNLSLALSSLALFSSLAIAGDIVTLGTPGYGGSGCPNGSASVTLSPDGSALTIIFDQFLVEAGGNTGKRLDRKNCNIAIPVHVPQGFSVSILDVDYRGFNALPKGGMSRFSAEYFFAGGRGPLFTKTFMGPLNQDYLVNNQLGVQSMVWSPCGTDVNLRVNASMMTQTNSWLDSAMSTVDTADFKSAMVYHLKFRSCY